jgi:hypothetical protein
MELDGIKQNHQCDDLPELIDEEQKDDLPELIDEEQKKDNEEDNDYVNIIMISKNNICYGNSDNGNVCNNIGCHKSGRPHFNRYIPPLCNRGKYCLNAYKCSYLHDINAWSSHVKKSKCKYAEKCFNYYCLFVHPETRKKKCEYGSLCELYYVDVNHKKNTLHPVYEMREVPIHEMLCSFDNSKIGCVSWDCEYKHIKSKPRCDNGYECKQTDIKHKESHIHPKLMCEYGNTCHIIGCHKRYNHPKDWPGACFYSTHCMDVLCEKCHPQDMYSYNSFIIKCCYCKENMSVKLGGYIPDFCPNMTKSK